MAEPESVPGKLCTASPTSERMIVKPYPRDNGPYVWSSRTVSGRDRRAHRSLRRDDLPFASEAGTPISARTLEVKARAARCLGLASPVASPVAAVHSGQGHRAQRAPQRVNEQGDRPGFGRHGAVEHLDGVAERIARYHRIPQHHDRV